MYSNLNSYWKQTALTCFLCNKMKVFVNNVMLFKVIKKNDFEQLFEIIDYSRLIDFNSLL